MWGGGEGGGGYYSPWVGFTDKQLSGRAPLLFSCINYLQLLILLPIYFVTYISNIQLKMFLEKEIVIFSTHGEFRPITNLQLNQYMHFL